MRSLAVLLLSGLLSAAARALASPYPRARVPSFAYSAPKTFLGLDDGFSDEIGHIVFLPGFHACGTLDILSVAGLDSDDFDLLPSYEGSVADRWLTAPTHMKESNSSEGTILAWAKGWRSSCGKGNTNKEVRVAKVLVDGVPDGAPRSEWAKALDEHLLPYISELPAAPHNSVVLVTSLSEPTLRALFDLAAPSSPPPPRPPPSDGDGRKEIPGRGHPRQHGLIWRTVAYMINLAFWAAVLIGLGYGSRWVAKKWRERQAARGGGAVALPGPEHNDLRVDLDSEEEEE
ncbi:hypothetical protein JCM3774_002946 [Rhodotorula dairenensis]